MRWAGWLGVGLLYAALAVGGWAGLALAAGGLLALGRAAYSKDAGFVLLGPLARWELVRAGRRRGPFVWRTVAAGAVAVTAGVIFNDQTGWWRHFPGTRPGVSHAAFARAAEQTVVMVAVGGGYLVYFFCLFQLPPIVPEEREQNRLDHLLVTDLRDHEILLGKTVGRLVLLFAYAAAGVPVLTIVSYYGGVPIERVLIGAAVALGGLAVFASVAVWVGAGAYRSAGAVGATFSVSLLFGYGLAGLVAFVEAASVPRPVSPAAQEAMREAAAVLNAPVPGNPVRLVQEFRQAAAANALGARAGELLRGFFACVLVFTVLFGWLAARRLRRVGMKPPAVSRPGVRGWFAGPPYRPPVTDRPVEWLARWTPGSGLERWLGRRVRGRWGLGGVICGLLIVAWAAWMDIGSIRRDRFLPGIVPAAGPVLGFAAVIPVGVLAARSVARERERDTLEALLLTGLEPGEIVRQKWWAAVRGADGQYVAGATAMLLSLLGGGSVFGMVAVLLVTAVNMSLAASLGLWCSVRAKTAGRAVLLLLGGTAVWTFGWWVIAASSGDRLAMFLVAVTTPVGTQSIAGLIGSRSRIGSDTALTMVTICGAASAALAAGLVFSTARSLFAVKVHPVREEAK